MKKQKMKGKAILLDPVNESQQATLMARCDHNTVLNCFACDKEVEVEKGFTMQVVATKQNTFAKFFFPQGVSPELKYFDKTNWEYDFWFVGSCDTSKYRRNCIVKLSDYLESNKSKIKFRIKVYNDFFPLFDDEKKAKINIGYQETLKNSKFALCPRGNGIQSIRFFEALAATTIPVYIGDNETRFPLDWIIDWDKAAVRIGDKNGPIGFKNIRSRGRNARTVHGVLDKLLLMSASEINERRKYIFEIFNKYMIYEGKFKNIVLDRVNQLIDKDCNE